MFNRFVVSKDNLINNINNIKSNNPYSKVCAMVKANAYGVGVKNVVDSIDDLVDYYGVSNIVEAREVAEISNKNILIVGSFERICDSRFEYMIDDINDVDFLLEQNVEIKIHLKINSGMNRYGLNSICELEHVLEKIKHSKIKLVGIFTHFATSDEFVDEQMWRFSHFALRVKQEYPFVLIHADNSAVNRKFNHNLGMVRIGFDLYNSSSYGFLPAVKIVSKVVKVFGVGKNQIIGYNKRCISKKNLRLGIVPVGYADGFSTSFIGIKLKTSQGEIRVLNICMDCILVDISKTKIKKGDYIEILNQYNPLSKYAEHSKTSEYEIMLGFSHLRAEKILIPSASNNQEQSQE